jgi:glc operon protein GlcG
MNIKRTEVIINSFFETLEKLIPSYKNSQEDWGKAEGNLAVLIIDQEGRMYGRLFGNDKIRQRIFSKLAWIKATQVYMTGMKTGEYEKLVFAEKINPDDYGIELPDLLGWEGGQPIKIDSETTLSVGFSGFTGVNDLQIVEDAFAKVMAQE